MCFALCVQRCAAAAMIVCAVFCCCLCVPDVVTPCYMCVFKCAGRVKQGVRLMKHCALIVCLSLQVV